jgi:HEAT repeat protein
VQDQEAAAEMVLNLAHTLQTYPQHTPAILQHAINGLGRVGNAAEHLPLIVPFLDRNWEQSVRLAAVRAIGALGGEAAIDALIGLLNDSDIVIRWEVQAALDRLLTAGADESPVQPVPAESEDRAEDSTTELPF